MGLDGYARPRFDVMASRTNPPVAAGRDPYADPNVRTRVVLTFEGGGSAGIGHVGALREIERAQDQSRTEGPEAWPTYDVKRVGGTSSGGVIAALVSVGYRADDIFPPTPVRPSGLIPRLRWRAERIREYFGWGIRSEVLKNARLRSVMQVFGGPGGRFLFRLLRFFLNHSLMALIIWAVIWIAAAVGLVIATAKYHPLEWLSYFVELCAVWLATLGMASAAEVLFSVLPEFLRQASRSMETSTAVALLLLGYLLATPLSAIVMVRYLLRGTFRTDRIAAAIDNALIAKLDETEPRRKPRRRLREPLRVRFRDLLPTNERPWLKPLSVVAADIDGKRLQLFSAETTPDAFVAEAVAASLSLPIVFRPRRVATVNGLFFDGGFVSNYPAWAFDDDRTIDEDLFTIGIEILERRPRRSPATWRRALRWPMRRLARFGEPFVLFGRFVLTTIFGSRVLERRFTRQVSIRMTPLT